MIPPSEMVKWLRRGTFVEMVDAPESYWSGPSLKEQVAADYIETLESWQSMETAPKDGTWFLADCFEDLPQVIKWEYTAEYSDGSNEVYRTVLTDEYVIPVGWTPLPQNKEDDNG